MATHSQPYGFSETIYSQRQSQDASPSVAAEVLLDCFSRQSNNASPFLKKVPVMHQMVTTEGEVELWSLSQGPGPLLLFTDTLRLAGGYNDWS